MEHSENNLLSSCRSNKNTKKKNWDVCSSFLILAPFILCAPSSWCPNCANLFHPSRHCHSFLLAILLLDWKNNRRWSVFHPTNTISGLASSIKFPFSSSGRIKRKFKHIGVNLSLQICFLFFLPKDTEKFFLDCRPDLICLWEKRLYLSLWPPRLDPADGSLSSTPIPSYSSLWKYIKPAKNGYSTVILCFRTHWCQVEDAVSKKEHLRGQEMWRTSFLFHRCPVDYPTKDSNMSD